MIKIKRDYLMGFMISSLILGLGMGLGMQLVLVFDFTTSISFKIFCSIFDGLLIYFFIDEIVRRIGGIYDDSDYRIEQIMKNWRTE